MARKTEWPTNLINEIRRKRGLEDIDELPSDACGTSEYAIRTYLSDEAGELIIGRYRDHKTLKELSSENDMKISEVSKFIYMALNVLSKDTCVELLENGLAHYVLILMSDISELRSQIDSYSEDQKLLKILSKTPEDCSSFLPAKIIEKLRGAGIPDMECFVARCRDGSVSMIKGLNKLDITSARRALIEQGVPEEKFGRHK